MELTGRSNLLCSAWYTCKRNRFINPSRYSRNCCLLILRIILNQTVYSIIGVIPGFVQLIGARNPCFYRNFVLNPSILIYFLHTCCPVIKLLFRINPDWLNPSYLGGFFTTRFLSHIMNLLKFLCNFDICIFNWRILIIFYCFSFILCP